MTATCGDDCVTRSEHRALYAMVLDLQNDVLALQQQAGTEPEQQQYGHALRWESNEDAFGGLNAYAENGELFATVKASFRVDGLWELKLPKLGLSCESKSEAIAEAQRRYVRSLKP